MVGWVGASRGKFFIVNLEVMIGSGNAGVVSKGSVISSGAQNLDLNSLSGPHTPTSRVSLLIVVCQELVQSLGRIVG